MLLGFIFKKNKQQCFFDKNIADYDCVVIIRPDINIHNKIDINWYAYLYDIIMAIIDWHGGCNDRVTIGKPNIVSYYGKLFDGLRGYNRTEEHSF